MGVEEKKREAQEVIKVRDLADLQKEHLKGTADQSNRDDDPSKVLGEIETKKRRKKIYSPKIGERSNEYVLVTKWRRLQLTWGSSSWGCIVPSAAGEVASQRGARTILFGRGDEL